MSPFFSIVIPLYNKEEFITDTLKSVLNQSFQDFEIIIVDDGSTDKSILKIDELDDFRIKIFNQNNKGASAARNKGIELANSKLIAFLDADDLWLPNHLETLKHLYEDFPSCGMYCSRYKTKISRKKIIENDLSDNIEKDFRGIVPDFFKASMRNRVAHTSAVMTSKKILRKVGLFNQSLSNGEDLDQWIRIASKYKVAISNNITSIYRFEIPTSLSKRTFLTRNLINFDKFQHLEKNNQSLKKFLDLYRLEYAIQYRTSGAICQSNSLLKKRQSITPLKTKILLKLPPILLKLLLNIKHRLKKHGITFTIYH